MIKNCLTLFHIHFIFFIFYSQKPDIHLIKIVICLFNQKKKRKEIVIMLLNQHDDSNPKK